MGMTLNLGISDARMADDSIFLRIRDSVLWIEFSKGFLKEKNIKTEELRAAKVICLTIGTETSVFSLLSLKFMDEISDLKILVI